MSKKPNKPSFDKYNYIHEPLIKALEKELNECLKKNMIQRALIVQKELQNILTAAGKLDNLQLLNDKLTLENTKLYNEEFD